MSKLVHNCERFTELDDGWFLSSSFAVFYMQSGFALIEAGSVRAKNTKNILFKNILILSLSVLSYWMVGFAFAFGSGPLDNPFIGTGNFFLIGYKDYSSFCFNSMVVAICATIASGSLAERTQLFAYIVYSLFMSTLINPIPTHWIWHHSGWLHHLGQTPFIDTSGASVIHMIGGCVGLAGAISVGPRTGRFQDKSELREFPGHSFPLITLGVFILWYGWYSLAGGGVGISGGRAQVQGRMVLNTTLAATTSGCVVLLCYTISKQYINARATVNGLITGLVSISAPCGVVEPYAAVIIAIVGSFLYLAGSWALDKAKIDDPVDGAPIHLLCGGWAIIATGLFATKENLYDFLDCFEAQEYGLFYGGGGEMLAVQLIGLATIAMWGFVWGFVVFFPLKFLGFLRVGHETELAGLDNTKCGGPAYPDFIIVENS